jgi:hypothetical protein
MDASAQTDDFSDTSSWNRERSSEELLSYIERRFSSLSDSDDTE